MFSGMVGKITKAGGTNAGTGGTFVPPVIQLKYALLKGHDERKRHPIFIIYYEIMQ